jgi:hypothetical protein
MLLPTQEVHSDMYANLLSMFAMWTWRYMCVPCLNILGAALDELAATYFTCQKYTVPHIACVEAVQCAGYTQIYMFSVSNLRCMSHV